MEVKGASAMGVEGENRKAVPARKPAGSAYSALSLPCARQSRHTTSWKEINVRLWVVLWGISLKMLRLLDRVFLMGCGFLNV